MNEKYEIINHGYDHSQYFQGCGTFGTNFSHCVTGCGNNAKEAYEDAAEQVSQMFEDAYKWLPKKPRGINAKDKVPARIQFEDSELCWYVSIRFNA